MAEQAAAATNRSNESARSVEEDLAALRADVKALTESISGLAKDKGGEVRPGPRRRMKAWTFQRQCPLVVPVRRSARLIDRLRRSVAGQAMERFERS